jgi:hypothetical protein
LNQILLPPILLPPILLPPILLPPIWGCPLFFWLPPELPSPHLADREKAFKPFKGDSRPDLPAPLGGESIHEEPRQHPILEPALMLSDQRQDGVTKPGVSFDGVGGRGRRRCPRTVGKVEPLALSDARPQIHGAQALEARLWEKLQRL